MPTADLPDRALLRLDGADAKALLQRLISQDMAKLAPDQALYGALLSPQGKYLFDFLLYLDGDAILLDCERTRRDDLGRRLMQYRLRADVGITAIDDPVFAGWGDDAPLSGWADPRLSALGRRYVGVLGPATATAADYDRHRLALGVPDASRDIEVEQSLALEANLDALHGVAFDKGCYVGQELTARTKYRGKVRYRLFPVEVEGELPATGTPITAGDREVGRVRSGREQRAIARLRVEDIAATPLKAGAATLHPIVPDWLQPVL